MGASREKIADGASASGGNDRRSAEIFLLNLEKWARGEPLVNRHAG